MGQQPFSTKEPDLSRRPTTFRQRDVTAAVKAVVAAGCPVARVRLAKDGEIVVEIGKTTEAPVAEADGNEWDTLP